MGLIIRRDEWLELDRPFSVWAYTVSFAQLLLRSPKDGRRTRVDIGFSGVKGVLLRPRFSSCVVRLADPSEIETVRGLLSLEELVPHEVWAVGEFDRPGFVVASSAEWQEDSGEFTDPSGVFLPAGPFSGLITE